MQIKKIVALATLMVSSYAMADTYVAGTYDQKDKLNTTEVHHVYGLIVGEKFSNGFTVEGRMEDEHVTTAGADHSQEGLLQIKASYDFTGLPVIVPFAGVAVGMKDKTTSQFAYYLYEAGLKSNFGPVEVKLSGRERQAFDSANNWDTHEYTAQIGYALTKKDKIAIAYKEERGTSNYNTKSINYTHSF